MKLSISLTDADVEALDRFAERTGLRSRSAAVQRAIRLLGQQQLESAYEAAWDDWAGSEEASLWDTAAGDGLTDAPR
ncbi:ribbon-helix-helix domain-containing protein [Tersicoccus sp. MR15.9]|uniref:ribbon-helix-helix domain-containing protein n=1 Tax=Tersicoccus mangrovi TaxID=3121635 RepID=UPI002FE5B2B5